MLQQLRKGNSKNDRQRGKSNSATSRWNMETQHKTNIQIHTSLYERCAHINVQWGLYGSIQWPPSSQAQSFFCLASFRTTLSSSLRDFCSSSRSCFIHLFSWKKHQCKWQIVTGCEAENSSQMSESPNCCPITRYDNYTVALQHECGQVRTKNQSTKWSSYNCWPLLCICLLSQFLSLFIFLSFFLSSSKCTVKVELWRYVISNIQTFSMETEKNESLKFQGNTCTCKTRLNLSLEKPIFAVWARWKLPSSHLVPSLETSESRLWCGSNPSNRYWGRAINGGSSVTQVLLNYINRMTVLLIQSLIQI